MEELDTVAVEETNECQHTNVNERCYCPDCLRYQHKLDEHCRCKCGYESHETELVDGQMVCKKCGKVETFEELQ